MRWRSRKALPAAQQAQPIFAPPDPAVIRAQLAAKSAAAETSRQKEWLAFIADEVLPWVNAALCATEPLAQQVYMLKIYGSRMGVTVWSMERNVFEVTWLKFLHYVLCTNPAYRGYKVKIIGVHRKSDKTLHVRVEMSMDDLERSMADFNRDTFRCPVKYYEVVIEP